ncbi:DNA topoisomerase 2-alpha-like isoform X2 [Centruroides sculpturatus]|uniref:DNA topoisomerase 2-alpha-like isoform X1 n=1 Tax=Centruroides sculpturatus TaxID=218467 RepID=UPI000C6DF45B|nr:DNA topoisomerase 2-alpha-like isoform X1 [Centruroides sculpturatus]XP_023226763.1 DNA topoisomerase 2-alpha-like isoform X2 [Centruroides sculpturatus]
MASKKEKLSDFFCENQELADNGDYKQKTDKRLSVERIYQKKTQLEHILLRPDTYIGSVEPVTQSMWVYDGPETGMIFRDVSFVPGLYKIFDEILVNAADNKQRDKSMDCIKVDIDPENNKISIWNNGKGIPVVEHKVEKIFVPSLIFGHLLTSSNYNDEEKKVTGGRNGYGAKLCNIFSTKFVVETSSKEYKKSFKQCWTDNMSKTTEARIIPNKGEDFTCVTFSPDLSKFGMEVLDKDTVALMSRRVYDVAGSSRGVKVYLNGKRLPIRGFKEYVEQYIKDKNDEQGNPLKVVYESVNDRWEVAVTMSERGFQQVSFVNSIATTKGGRHVDYVTEQIVSKLADVVKKKNKGGVQIKPFQIKNHMWVFVNCLIENPTFDSQTKENMTLQAKNFGSKCPLSDKFFNQVIKCGIIECIMSWVRFKAQTELNKKCSATKHSKLRGIPKLEDANDAGTKGSIDCTLILTEGDSAKTLAVSGLGVVGRDKYGVFPLRGKMLNVREATHKQILENQEINNIIKIMGLQYKKKYESIDDLKTLRYGRLMIMTDQDQDGSHIKGLLINFIHHNWPSLLRLPFLEEFITPIVKISKGKEEMSFYSLPEYEEWKQQTPNWNTWKIKYYKGLGTSTSKEAKEYFADMNRHRIKFKYEGTQDDNAIQLAFSKKLVDQRKEWLTNGMEERKHRRELGLPELYLYGKNTTNITFNDFVNKELILFSNMDNERSIPSLVDGLKPGQRKVMYTCFKRNDKREIKVAQLAGSVAEHSAYHHGESALMGTIINLAQNFVGSNNINLLQPIGQFGTRLQGGKDAASPRYIFTMLSPLAKLIFSQLDEPLLVHLFDDNQRIEPEYYIPVIPMVLVNGCEGIGTGWSTKIPNYNPREIVSNIRRMLKGEEPVKMNPWFKNFKGVIEQLDNQRYVINGEVSILSSNKLEITELPVRTWTQTYKEQVLETMLHGSDKVPSLITDYKEYHTDSTVRFVVTMNEEKLSKSEEQGLHKVFKLQTTLSTSSMVLFDHKGCLRRYDSPEEILKEFFEVRLSCYERRKAYLEGMLTAESKKLDSQARFILEKIEGKIIIENRKKSELIRTLQERGYESDPVKSWKESQNKNTDNEETNEDDEERDSSGPDYDYLLGMNLWSLTRERKDELLKKRDDKRAELEALREKTPADLWEDDLTNLMVELDRVEEKEREDEIIGGTKKAIKLGKSGKGRKVALEETKPSPMGQRVIPHIDPDLKKRAEKTPLGTGEGKRRGKGKKTDSELIKELCENGEEGLGNSDKSNKMKKKLKCSSTLLKAVKKSGSPKGNKKGPKRNPWSSESDGNESNNSDVDDITIPTEKRDVAPRRAAAAARAKYTFDSDEDIDEQNKLKFISENSDMSDFENAKVPTYVNNAKISENNVFSDSEKEEKKADDKVISLSDDSDDSFKSVQKPKSLQENERKTAFVTTDNKESLFDSLFSNEKKNNVTEANENICDLSAVSNSDDDGSGVELIIEKEKKQQKKRPRKKVSSEESDDDFMPKPKKPTAGLKKSVPAPKKKNMKSLYEEDGNLEKEIKSKKVLKKTESDVEQEDGFPDTYTAVQRSRSARSRAPIKYNFGEDSSEEEF